MFGEIVLAFLFGLILALLFSYGFGRPGPFGGFMWFFLVVFLAAWAIGVWAEPVGPVMWDIAWVPILFGALFVALLLAAVPPLPGRPVEATAPEAVGATAALGLFFWLMLGLLVISILFAYI